ncbi:MAG: PIN domain-containing protein [Treponema sp.]|nr:PIN domain-containing protein [Treponema sp.]
MQVKIYMESEAVLNILNLSKKNNYEIIGSSALDLEIEQIDNIEKRDKIKYFYYHAITKKLDYNINVFNRVKELSEHTKIRTLDSFHLSFAEYSDVDVLLTTDKKFEKACSKMNLKVKVMNPIKYLMEVLQNDSNV